MLKKPLIIGNWKMNKTPEESDDFLQKVLDYEAEAKPNCEIAVSVPFICLSTCIDKSKSSPIKIGAQNCYFEENGAFTGEISASMLSRIGADFVILGHSERRRYFSETSEIINLKVRSAIKNGLDVVICVGESLSEKEKLIADEIILMQTKIALFGVDINSLSKVSIAYEPLWAIGSGDIEKIEKINEMCEKIHRVVDQIYNKGASATMKVLYGGSVNIKNLSKILSKANTDGVLIGSASLVSDEFLKIIEFASKHT
ncbi:MAG: triose-phosphate isomerase [Oscillospiraceae bacterium]|nr:triose-phosphate isomerase [Oscillospiraceae bacterium]